MHEDFFFDAWTPELRKELENLDQNVGVNFLAHLERERDETTGFRIVKKIIISDDKVLVQVEGQGEQGPADSLLLKKIGDDWKLSDHL